MPVTPLLIPVGNAGPATGDGNNTYLLMPPGEPGCLIDAGIGSTAHLEALAARVAERRGRLSTVLVSHAHADHASGAPALAARFGVADFRKYCWPADDVDEVAWRHIGDNARIEVAGVELVALHTPGHAPDHLAFWHEPTRTVFTGDLVHANSSVAVIFSRGGDLRQYLASLERILALEPQTLLPAHGVPPTDPGLLLRATLAHRRRREAQVRAAVAAGRRTVETIAESIYDGLAPTLLTLARENVRAHLEKLKDDGEVVADREGWRPA